MVDRYFPLDASHLIAEEDEPWVKALQAIDENGTQKQALLRLLRSNVLMSADARWHLADLLERHKLGKQANRGGKRTPSYDFPPAQLKLVRAKRFYDQFIARGEGHDQAVAKTITAAAVSEETFRLFLAGRLGSARRVKKRKPPTSRP